jgi:hypothetical protein
MTEETKFSEASLLENSLKNHQISQVQIGLPISHNFVPISQNMTNKPIVYERDDNGSINGGGSDYYESLEKSKLEKADSPF